jgi:thymidylate synthase (FAD)
MRGQEGRITLINKFIGGNMRVEVMWVTPHAEKMIADMARVSSEPKEEWAKLFRYMMKNGHWSPFQMANMCVYIETSRDISAQIARHWSMNVGEPLNMQEFSQRYSEPTLEIEPVFPRTVGSSNRQSGQLLDSSDPRVDKFLNIQREVYEFTSERYHELIDAGIHREVARSILPTSTQTKLYLNGTARSWIFYFNARMDSHAQYEHRLLATMMYKHFASYFPTIAKIMPEVDYV